MKLSDLLDGVGESLEGQLERLGEAPPVDFDTIEIEALAIDHRAVTKGALFACIRGTRHDGHDHARHAVERGAVAVLAEHPVDVDAGVAQILTPSVRMVIGPLASRFHGDPSNALRIVGITGTNGKTTVAHLLDAIAVAAGSEAAIVGTLGARWLGEARSTGFTTPEAVELQAMFAAMRDGGVDVVAMEVSSHALEQRRVDGTTFAVVGFTNLSPEHLDLHGDLEGYFAAKARLFDGTFTDHAVVCVDDAFGDRLARLARAELGSVVTVASNDSRAHEPVDIRAENVLARSSGLRFDLVDGSNRMSVELRLLGRFNVANALVAYALGRQLGVEPATIVGALAAVEPIPGRLERVENGLGVTVVVDYAHTPDALDTVLANLREIAPAPARLIAVYGCGGDRDATKRGPMGRAVARGADVGILTSDNPRSESPQAIIDDVLRGLDDDDPRPVVVVDRRAAIEHAIGLAARGDVVLIAGKGHETGQTIGEAIEPFDDRLVAARVVERRGTTS